MGTFLATPNHILPIYIVQIRMIEHYLSHDIASGSDITPCNKINKPLVVYRFSENVMTSILTLHKIRENLDVFTPKMQFLSIFNVM